MPVKIAEPSAEEKKAAIGEHVGVHHPHQRRLRETEIAADRGQGDVDDGRVEHDHQLAGAQHVKREPTLRHFFASGIGVLKKARAIETIQSLLSIGAKWLAPGETASRALGCRREISPPRSRRTMSPPPDMMSVGALMGRTSSAPHPPPLGGIVPIFP